MVTPRTKKVEEEHDGDDDADVDEDEDDDGDDDDDKDGDEEEEEADDDDDDDEVDVEEEEPNPSWTVWVTRVSTYTNSSRTDSFIRFFICASIEKTSTHHFTNSLNTHS